MFQVLLRKVSNDLISLHKYSYFINLNLKLWLLSRTRFIDVSLIYCCLYIGRLNSFCVACAWAILIKFQRAHSSWICERRAPIFRYWGFSSRQRKLLLSGRWMTRDWWEWCASHRRCFEGASSECCWASTKHLRRQSELCALMMRSDRHCLWQCRACHSWSTWGCL